MYLQKSQQELTHHITHLQEYLAQMKRFPHKKECRIALAFS